MGFGALWGNVARCEKIWGTFAQKVSDKFCQSIFSEDNLDFLASILKQQQKGIACVSPTVGVGRCGKMLKKVERCGDRLPSKPYGQV